MDIASLVGLIGAVGAILAAMIAGGGVAPLLILSPFLSFLAEHSSPSCMQTLYQFFLAVLERWQKLLCLQSRSLMRQ